MIRGKIYLGSRFERFQSKTGWFHCFGFELRQYSTVVGARDRRDFLPHGNQEAMEGNKLVTKNKI